MKPLDFFFLTVVAATAGLSYQLGWYSASIFCTLMFLLFLVSVAIHYISAPLPRFLLGATILPVSEEELQELKTKKDSEDK